MTDTFDDAQQATGWFPSAAVTAAEISVLGAALQSRSAAEIMMERLNSQDFFKPAHQLVYEAVAELVTQGHPIDPGAVLEELTSRQTATQVGGGPALLTLIEHCVAVSSVGYHAEIVRGDAVRRRVFAAGLTISQMGEFDHFDVDTHVEQARKVLDDACENVTSDEPPPVHEVLSEVLDGLGSPLDADKVITPPYLDMEMFTAGFRGGQLITIAARPGMGKSVTALDWLRHTSIRLGIQSLLVTLEMTRHEVLERMLAAEGSVFLKSIRDHELSDDDWSRLSRANAKIISAPMVIDDNPDYTINRLRSRLRTMARRNPARLVIIDYLQLMKMPRADSREQSVAAMARALKLLAREFDVPILLLAQLNRGPELRQDKKPVMADIRESGAIEQDSDMVILIHREASEDKESPRAGESDLIIAKHRNGATGIVTIGFMGHYARGCNLAKTPVPSSWSPS